MRLALKCFFVSPTFAGVATSRPLQELGRSILFSLLKMHDQRFTNAFTFVKIRKRVAILRSRSLERLPRRHRPLVVLVLLLFQVFDCFQSVQKISGSHMIFLKCRVPPVTLRRMISTKLSI